MPLISKLQIRYGLNKLSPFLNIGVVLSVKAPFAVRRRVFALAIVLIIPKIFSFPLTNPNNCSIIKFVINLLSI